MNIIHANFRKPVSFHGNAQVVHFPRVNQRTGESPTLADLLDAALDQMRREMRKLPT